MTETSAQNLQMAVYHATGRLMTMQQADTALAALPVFRECAPVPALEPQPIGLLTERLARLEDRVTAGSIDRAHESFAETATSAMRRVLALEAADERLKQRVTALEAKAESTTTRRVHDAFRRSYVD